MAGPTLSPIDKANSNVEMIPVRFRIIATSKFIRKIEGEGRMADRQLS
jgi:hypothetical protein